MKPFSDRTQAIANRIGQVLESRGVRAYLVGGAIRDGLLGRSTDDLDIVIDASPHEIAAELAGAVDGHPVSLDTTRDMLRIVVESGGNKTDVDLAQILNGDILYDLRSRDFTVDSIAIEYQSAIRGCWTLIDPLAGAEDVRNRTIRADSDAALAADPVRILRAVRITAETGFEIEPSTQALLRRDAALLTQSAPERRREELLRILAAPDAGASVRMLDSLAILSVLMPELDEARGVEQPKEHHYDVFGHLLAAVDFADQIVADRYSQRVVAEMMPRFDGMAEYFAQPVADGHSRGTFLKLAALLHDIAKPATRTVDPSGRIRFFGHSEVGEEIAADILGRLRVSRRGARLVREMVRHHLRPRLMADKGELPTGRAIRRYYRDLNDAALDTLYLNMADFLAARGPLLTRDDLEVQIRVIGHILNVGPEEPASDPPLSGLLTGHDVMRELGLEPGPLVGWLLAAVAKAEANGRVSNRCEALALARRDLESGGGGG